MNISNMLSGDADEDKRKRPSPETGMSVRSFTTPLTNGQSTTSSFPAQPQSNTPMHAPPPLPIGRSSTGPGLTPLHTPGQTAMSGQYPFPSSAGPQHSAVAAPPPQPQPYRTHESYSATTPGGRPPSHGHMWQSPSQPPPMGLPHGIHPQQPNSVSPTPSSHPSQHTPHSVRQSPLPYSAHPPYGHPSSGGHQPPYQQSQPSTPLGPPPLIHHRSVGSHPDVPSPYHQRTYSSTSNGFPANSPSINNLVESPNAHFRPSPSHQRRVSEYRPFLNGERERSISVSPKTQVAPRPQSLGSRHSSSHELQSAGSNRSSVQQSGPVITQPVHHVTQPQFHPPGSHGSGLAQPLPNLNTPASEAYNQHFPRHTPPPPTSQLPHPPPISQLSYLTSSTPTRAHDMAATQQLKRPANGDAAISHPSIAQPPHPEPSTSNRAHETATAKSLKRPADGDTASGPPVKRTKRKYASRPPWAVLSKHNPRWDSRMPQPVNGKPRPAQQPNGHSELLRSKPWQQSPPLDYDLIRVRSVVGTWEKSMNWNTPCPDLLKVVQDWLYVKLDELKDVGTDPREGTIEIEARVGNLINHGTDTRCSLPVLASTVINPRANSEYTFKSAMAASEHKALNDSLNQSVRESMSPGRVKIDYKHLYETDSFHTLSPLGLAALPESIKSRRHGDRAHAPRLRISRDSNTGEVLARIVKIHLDDLHIFNPQSRYDIRISLNLEVNLDRPGLDPTALALPEPHKDPERVKDRLSYKHLAYSIDLTKVSSRDRDDLYELEVEVDANVLREQLQLVKAGEENVFGDVVSGFLDNMTFLVRH